jgi:hypothetical protein
MHLQINSNSGGLGSHAHLQIHPGVDYGASERIYCQSNFPPVHRQLHPSLRSPLEHFGINVVAVEHVHCLHGANPICHKARKIN